MYLDMHFTDKRPLADHIHQAIDAYHDALARRRQPHVPPGAVYVPLAEAQVGLVVDGVPVEGRGTVAAGHVQVWAARQRSKTNE